MDIEAIFSDWKLPFITRKQLCERLNGLYSPKTLKVLDCHGKGIPGGIRIEHNKLVYPIENVIKWLDEKINKAE